MDLSTLIATTARMCGIYLHDKMEIYSFIETINQGKLVYHPPTMFVKAVEERLLKCKPPRKIHYVSSRALMTIDFKPQPEGV